MSKEQLAPEEILDDFARDLKYTQNRSDLYMEARKKAVTQLAKAQDVCPECKGQQHRGTIHIRDEQQRIIQVICPTCKGTGKAHRLDREKIAKTPIETHKYKGKRYLTLNSVDQIPKGETDG